MAVLLSRTGIITGAGQEARRVRAIPGNRTGP